MTANPNIALLLMVIGTLGVFVEFCRPGGVVPGVLGGVAVVVGAASLMNLAPGAPVSWPLAAALLFLVGAVGAALLKIALRARRNKRTI